MNTCKTCAYFHDIGNPYGGHCYRYPPTVACIPVLRDGSSIECSWDINRPFVANDEVKCGEYRLAEQVLGGR